MKNGFSTIDEYIKTFPEDIQRILEKMRQIIREAAPEAVEAISYQMPTFKLNGNLVHFAAFKDHIGFYPVPSGIESFRKELSSYITGKGTVQFPLDKPIPYDLVKKIVVFRVKENLAKRNREIHPKQEAIPKYHLTINIFLAERRSIMTNITQKIKPNLWFDRQAEEAVNYYSSVFTNSRTGRITRASKAGFDIHGVPENTVLTVEFEIEGQQFMAINGGPLFKFNPAISFLVACDTKEEVSALWEKLSDGGSVLMKFGEYSFSEKYGWTQDKYGLSWQVMFRADHSKQKITPTLMFVGEQHGKAETAIKFYTALFKHSEIGGILRYGRGMEPDIEGTLQHAAFTLEDQEFAAMDSALEHNFSFNEAISLMVETETQAEIDYYWEKLTADGGQEGMCGWLKDKFGVSWQVTPNILGKMLGNPDIEKVKRVTNAFLKMKKFDIGELRKEYEG